ncbi:MAG: hypothetical protein ABSA13_11785 [Beijerinckiaceae bacterium]|jgi:hypothetical protein
MFNKIYKIASSVKNAIISWVDSIRKSSYPSKRPIVLSHPYPKFENKIVIHDDEKAEMGPPRNGRTYFDKYIDRMDPTSFVYRIDTFDSLRTNFFQGRLALEDIFLKGHRYSNTIGNFYNTDRLEPYRSTKDMRLVDDMCQEITKFLDGDLPRGLYVWLLLRDAVYAQNYQQKEAVTKDTIASYRCSVSVLTRFSYRHLDSGLIFPDPITFVAPSACLSLKKSTLDLSIPTIGPEDMEIWYKGSWHPMTPKVRQNIIKAVLSGNLALITHPPQS